MANAYDTDDPEPGTPEYRRSYEQQLRRGPTAMLSPDDPSIRTTGYMRDLNPEQPYPYPQPPPDQEDQPPPDQGGYGPTLPPALGGPSFFGPNRPTRIAENVPPQTEEERWKQRTQPPPPDKTGTTKGVPGAQPPQPQGPPGAQRGPALLPPRVSGQQGIPPFRPAPRQFFVPSMPNRDAHMWGAPPRFPILPGLWQVPMILAGLGMNFGQWGSGSPEMPGSIQFLGLGLNRFARAFMNGYQRGQGEYTRQQAAQMKMYAEELEIQHDRQIREYGQIMALYGDGKHPQQLYDALLAKANELNDGPTIAALQNEGPDGVVNLKKWLDAQGQDIHRSNKTLQKEQEQRDAEQEEQNRWGGRGPQQPQGPQTDVMGRPIEQPQARPAPGQQPALPPPGGGPTDEAHQVVGNEPIGQTALGMFRGGEEPAGMDKDKKDEAAALAARLQQRLDQIRDSGLRGKAMMEALEKFDPATASTLQDILEHARDVPQRAAGGKSHPYWDTMTSLARAVDPNWMPQQFAATKELYDTFYQGKGPNFVRVSGAAQLAQAVAKFRQTVRELPDTTNWAQGLWDLYITKGEGDPRYVAAATAWRQVVIKSSAVAKGAAPAVSEEKALADAVPLWGTKAQMLEAMQVDLSDAKIQYDIAKSLWQKQLHLPLEGDHGMPNYDKDVDAALDAVENRMDPNTGKIDGEVPRLLKWNRLSHNPDIRKLQTKLKDPKMADDPRRAETEALLQKLLKEEEEPE